MSKILLQGLQPNQVVIADRAYDADWIRALIYGQGAIDCISSKSNRICPKPFGEEQYKQRHKIECFFGRIKKLFRSIATRYDKYALSFMAMIKIDAIRIWGEFYESAI